MIKNKIDPSDKLYKLVALALILLSSIASAQKNNVIKWIESNSIELPQSDFNIDLDLFKAKLSSDFLRARIYGFGEATHHNKEFSDIKSQFFKYLVVNQGVRIFILEESYGAAYDINRYISGNGGNLRDLVLSFRQGIWQTEEMFNLIAWIKSYNSTKAENEKVKFYGNDCMFNYNIAAIIKEIIQKDSISISEDELKALDFFSTELFSLPKESEATTAKIKEAKKFIKRINENQNSNKDLIYAVNALSNFFDFLSKPTQETRDKSMAESVDSIYNNLGDKIFIWAHNEHIKKTTIFNDNAASMGNWLEKKYNDKYYSIGFEFGVGTMWVYNPTINTAKSFVLDKPIKDTNSEFFYESDFSTFYLDFSTAVENDTMYKFLFEKRNFLVIGGYGLSMKNYKYQVAREKFIDMYDGLIYIRKVSLSSPLK